MAVLLQRGALQTLTLAWLGCLCAVTGQYYGNYYCRTGRDVVVHLFEWKWKDIEKECTWLAQNNYCAVQVIRSFGNIYVLDQGVASRYTLLFVALTTCK